MSTSKKNYHFPIAQKINGTLLIGKPLKTNILIDEEMSYIRTMLNLDNNNSIIEYNSILSDGKIFYETVKNSTRKRTNDSFIFNELSKRYADIKSIFVVDDSIYLLLNEQYDVIEDINCESIVFLEKTCVGAQTIITPDAIGVKNALIGIDDGFACSKFPNLFEKN